MNKMDNKISDHADNGYHSRDKKKRDEMGPGQKIIDPAGRWSQDSK